MEKYILSKKRDGSYNYVALEGGSSILFFLGKKRRHLFKFLRNEILDGKITDFNFTTEKMSFIWNDSQIDILVNPELLQDKKFLAKSLDIVTFYRDHSNLTALPSEDEFKINNCVSSIESNKKGILTQLTDYQLSEMISTLQSYPYDVCSLIAPDNFLALTPFTCSLVGTIGGTFLFFNGMIVQFLLLITSTLIIKKTWNFWYNWRVKKSFNLILNFTQELKVRYDNSPLEIERKMREQKIKSFESIIHKNLDYSVVTKNDLGREIENLYESFCHEIGAKGKVDEVKYLLWLSQLENKVYYCKNGIGDKRTYGCPCNEDTLKEKLEFMGLKSEEIDRDTFLCSVFSIIHCIIQKPYEGCETEVIKLSSIAIKYAKEMIDRKNDNVSSEKIKSILIEGRSEMDHISKTMNLAHTYSELFSLLDDLENHIKVDPLMITTDGGIQLPLN